MATRKIGDITVRDIVFDLDRAPKVWFPNKPGVTAFFDALSVLFPHGERVFIRSVLHYRKDIEDPKLLEQIDGFKGQEAMHTREHENYNRRLRSLGYDVDALEAKQAKTIDWIENDLGPEMNLAVTVCMEHFTTIMAAEVTTDPVFFEGAHPSFRDIWSWHAMEEAEHSSVAFDVLRKVRPGYFFRCGAMLLTTFLFLRMVTRNLNHILARDKRRFSINTWLEMLNYFYISPGFSRRMIWPYLRFFMPGFHPSAVKPAPFAMKLKAQFDEMSGAEAA